MDRIDKPDWLADPIQPMPAPSIRQLAAHLGISKAMVGKLRDKGGMPTNSLRAAKLWRESQNKQRAATSAKKDEKCKSAAEPKFRGRPIKPPKPSKTGDSLLDALSNTIVVADAAFKAYHHAMSKGLSTQTVRLSEHSKAIDARLKAEKAYREEMERRGLLVPKSQITDLCRRCMDTVLRRLKKLPTEQGPQCNPQEPLMAVRILEREVNEILSAGQKALATL